MHKFGILDTLLKTQFIPDEDLVDMFALLAELIQNPQLTNLTTKSRGKLGSSLIGPLKDYYYYYYNNKPK